ncbi:hypothetical protein D3C74_332950 [compost metagenome]
MSDDVNQRNIDTIFNVKTSRIIAKALRKHLAQQIKRGFMTDSIAEHRCRQFVIINEACMQCFPPLSGQRFASRNMAHIGGNNEVTDRFPFQLAHPAFKLPLPFGQRFAPQGFRAHHLAVAFLIAYFFKHIGQHHTKDFKINFFNTIRFPFNN